MTLFSNDLVSNAKKHLQFLKDIHAYNQTTFVSSSSVTNVETDPTSPLPSSVKEIESLRRYQDLWLPFVVANTTTIQSSLIPPPDIAWLWHCHRLAPQEYTKYCETVFHGKLIIEAKPPFSFVQDDEMKTKTNVDDKMASAVAHTKELWKETYPNESFFLNKISESTIGASYTHPYLNGYDLLGSARRQTAFLWQVSGDKYACDKFLKQGVKNYEKFLKLTPQANDLGMILVPTYQIDLMWHTHILSSISDYNKDCISIIKSHVYHDDSLTDREEGGILDVSYDATQKLWKSVYGVDYMVPGGMYRGEPPSTYYTKAWSFSSATGSTLTSSTQNTHGLALIGKVGASSTSSNVLSSPKPWVPLDGTASDGRPAFIRTEEQLKNLVKELPYRENYVFCRIKRINGYYHIETKEAQKVMYYRMSDRLHTLSNEMMVEMCTCGLSKKNKATSTRVEYKNLKVICDTMQKQLFMGGSGGTTIPPETMFTCAGGACGGAVALKADSEYAAACGTIMTTYAGTKLGIAGGFASG